MQAKLTNDRKRSKERKNCRTKTKMGGKKFSTQKFSIKFKENSNFKWKWKRN